MGDQRHEVNIQCVLFAGWRFALIEMQAIAASLIENFEFSLPSQTKENIIKRMPIVIMAPAAEGHPGAWLGLKVKYCGES